MHSYLVNTFSSHEVDRTLRYLEKQGRNQPTLVLGDSVGHGVFSGWRLKAGRIASLACNQATETAGQYFFLKRFLSKNKTPGAVISCDRTPLMGNLNQVYTENYIQRCFTRWYEIYDLLLAKRNPAFTAKMIAYKLFATYKFRLHLQEKLVGFTNSDIYSGILRGKNSVKVRYGIVRILSDIVQEFRQESISQYFFKKMLTELESLHVPLYYLPAPTQLSNNATNKLVQNSLHDLEKLQFQFGNLTLLPDSYQRMVKKYFRDGVHLNPKGLILYRNAVGEVVKKIVSDAVVYQQKMFDTIFRDGTDIFDYSSEVHFNRIKPLYDVTINMKKGQLVLQSHGNDPAVLVGDKIEKIGGRGRTLAVRVTMKSEVKSITTLYYSQGDHA
ncbi:MAG: hypothetical protein KAI39_08935, partial [Desulfobulbaceae bacterium]|nr:hypothetical protein [Desulfobulbaceae bacterium]